MLESLLVVAGQVGTLFLLLGVGFALAQLGRLTPEGLSQMAYLAMYIVTPCVIIHSFSAQLGTARLLGQLGIFLLAYILCTVLCILGATPTFRKEPPRRGGPIRFGMIYGNNGFMGLPLAQSILGPQAVIFASASAVVFNFLLWTHGVKTMGGRVTLRQVLVNPATVGIAAALPLFLLGWRLPSVVNDTVSFIANLNTPLAMIVIGGQMAGADLLVSFTSLRLYRAAAYRLVLAPLIPLVLLLPLHLDPLIYCVCVIMCAVPTAGATGMFSQRFGQDTAVAAQMVTLTTLLSIFTLPLFAVAARMLSS